MKTRVFKSFQDFLNRKDLEVNGVSEEFLNTYTDAIEDNESNISCWNCYGCRDCRNDQECIRCVYCVECEGCIDCRYCSRCNQCSRCEESTGCVGCHNCSYCTDSVQREYCHLCINGINLKRVYPGNSYPLQSIKFDVRSNKNSQQQIINLNRKEKL